MLYILLFTAYNNNDLYRFLIKDLKGKLSSHEALMRRATLVLSVLPLFFAKVSLAIPALNYSKIFNSKDWQRASVESHPATLFNNHEPTSRLEVQIHGLNTLEKKLVELNLSILAAEKEQDLNLERVIALNNLAKEEIITSLQILGYYQATIKSELITTQNGWKVNYEIDPGRVTLIQEVHLKLIGEGKEEPLLIKFMQSTPLKAGQVLNHTQYETFKQNWLDKALQLGYLAAIFNVNEIRVDVKNARAEIVLELDTRKRYYFGDIQFEEPPYSIDYLNRHIPFKPGTPYTTEQLLQLQKNLTETELFSKVRIDPQISNENTIDENFDHDPYCVPLKVCLTRRPRNRYTASTGYGTDTGPRGTLGYERKLETFPGHRFSMNIKGSKRYNQGNLQYAIPGKNPASDRLVFGYQITEEKLVDKKYSLLEELGTTLIQKEGFLEQILALQYRHEKFRILQTQPKQSAHFLLPSIGLIWSNIDRKALLPLGVFASLNVRGGLGLLLSSTNLLQAESRLKWALPLGDCGRVIFRTDFGATALSNPQDFPLSLRFFAGGDHSVRGYGYQSLGPKGVDNNGNVIVVGGRDLFVGSLEIERIIYKNITGAVFLDNGNAFNKWKTKLYTGAGFGLRWCTPLGPIRLDIAQAIVGKKHRNKKRYKPRIHLTFGIDL